MVYDELEMLQRMKHPHIVRFVDWFESRVRYDFVRILYHGWANGSTPRTNTISSRNWLQEENCSIESASKDDSPRRMHHKRSDKFLRPSITYMTTMSFTEVSKSVPLKLTSTF